MAKRKTAKKSEKKVLYELLFFSKNGNILFRNGTFGTKDEALAKINEALGLTPGATSWKVIKVTKEIDQEGEGPLRRPGVPAPSGQGRWW